MEGTQATLSFYLLFSKASVGFCTAGEKRTVEFKGIAKGEMFRQLQEVRVHSFRPSSLSSILTFPCKALKNKKQL